jgi:ubiquinone/menaquinone biosynthesis C-methylase UbiE
MVAFYDETRVFDKGCFESALDFLVEKLPPRMFSKVFESGIGTGRIAIPLAERGYRITGVDISEEMLALLKRRLTQSRRSLQISFQKADATKLPFTDAAFDMAIAVHLFYFIREWKKAADEILRVVKGDGPVVLMHTGMGREIPLLNERYKALCAEQGCSIKQMGVKGTGEVVDYFTDLGCHAEWNRDRWQWTSHIRLDEALSYVKSRTYSFTTLAPDDIHSKAIERLESELRHQFGSLTAKIEILNQVYLVVILR